MIPRYELREITPGGLVNNGPLMTGAGPYATKTEAANAARRLIRHYEKYHGEQFTLAVVKMEPTVMGVYGLRPKEKDDES